MSNKLKPAGSDKGKPRVQCIECNHKTVNPLGDSDFVNETVKVHKRNQKLRDKNRIKNKALTKQVRVANVLEEQNIELIDLLKKQNLSKIVKTHKTKKGSKVGVVHVSDTHINEIINLRENKYDVNIASKRLQKFANEIKELFISQQIKEVIVAFTGDLLNSNRRNDEFLNEATNRTRATFLAVDLFKSFLLDLNKNFNLHVTYTSGNESRIEKDWGWTDIVSSDNFDDMIFNILKLILDGKKGIIFDGESELEKVINVNGCYFLLLHGNSLKDKGIEKQVQGIIGKVAKERGIIIDYVLMGHYHSCAISEFYGRSSSLAGSNTYSSYGLQLISRASQNCYSVGKNKDINSFRVDLQNVEDIEGYELPNVKFEYEKASDKKRKQKVFTIVA